MIAKQPTFITGFDFITDGGLPRHRSTLIAGSAGSGKTVFAMQFLIEGIREAREPGVFVTCEESPEQIRENMAGFGWPIDEYERDGLLRFVDASPEPSGIEVVGGPFDLEGLMARIEYAIGQTGASRVSIDSVGSLLDRFDDLPLMRRELLRLSQLLRRQHVTSLLTAERVQEYGPVGRHGIEEFVTDNVVILRNALDEERRRRTIEILKFRGTDHRKGEFPFSVSARSGFVVIPLSAMTLGQRSSAVRITSGSSDLDQMCGGGFYRDSVVLVSGATGTGKTLMATEFMAGAVAESGRCLYLGFEESRDQLFRNASGWGVDFEQMEQDGMLRVVSAYPESEVLEDHLINIKYELDSFAPTRVAIDSLSALERVGTRRGFREFVVSLTSYIKEREIACVFTATSPDLLGGTSVTEAHISTITDSIILLRYVEIDAEIRRAVTVLKMRGSGHDRNIREFMIDATGMRIGEPLRNTAGILLGGRDGDSPRRSGGFLAHG